LCFFEKRKDKVSRKGAKAQRTQKKLNRPVVGRKDILKLQAWGSCQLQAASLGEAASY
jgi:hypothetical protein